MLSVTFDTNLLIDLEEKRLGFEKVLEIVDLHNSGKIKLCIPAIAASEKLLDEKHIPNYKLFEEYLNNLKIVNYEELKPLMYVDMCYINHSLVAGDELIALDHLIHKILFPSIEVKLEDFYRKQRSDSEVIQSKWRNAKIDVQMLWCHIFHKKDIFITRDENFRKKEPRLNEQIGKVVITNPEQFLEKYNA